MQRIGWKEDGWASWGSLNNIRCWTTKHAADQLFLCEKFSARSIKSRTSLLVLLIILNVKKRAATKSWGLHDFRDQQHLWLSPLTDGGKNAENIIATFLGDWEPLILSPSSPSASLNFKVNCKSWILLCLGSSLKFVYFIFFTNASGHPGMGFGVWEPGIYGNSNHLNSGFRGFCLFWFKNIFFIRVTSE